MRKIFLGVLISFSISGCATVKLTKEEQDVRILRKADAPMGCKEMKELVASKMYYLDDEACENSLRKQAHDIGANVVMLTVQNNDTVAGYAYNCP